MPTNKEQVIAAVQSYGEIGVAGLAEALALDKGTVRKVALEAAREGRIGTRNDGQGYVFFMIGGAASVPVNAVDHHRLERRQPDTNVIAGTFQEIAPPPSQSRALIPTINGPPATFDSRLAGTLARNRHPSRPSPGRNSMDVPGGFFTGMNSLFVGDPYRETAPPRNLRSLRHAGNVRAANCSPPDSGVRLALPRETILSTCNMPSTPATAFFAPGLNH